MYVDLAFWNFNVERLITLRLTFDMPLSGGVYPKVAVRVADLYTCSIARWSSAFDAAKTCSTSHQVRFVFEGLCLMAIVLVAIMAILQIFGAMFYILVLHYGLIEDERTSIAQCFQACLCSLKRSNNGEHATTLYDRPDSLSEVNADDGGSFSGRKSKKKDNSTLWKHAKHVFTNYAREWWFWQFYLLLQLFVYFTYLLVRVITMELVPLGVDVGTDSYINFQTPALWADYSDRVNSFFIFLSWVRLFEFFNFFSGRNLGLFVLMAGVFILGSALANLIALGYYVKVSEESDAKQNVPPAHSPPPSNHLPLAPGILDLPQSVLHHSVRPPRGPAVRRHQQHHAERHRRNDVRVHVCGHLRVHSLSLGAGVTVRCGELHEQPLRG